MTETTVPSVAPVTECPPSAVHDMIVRWRDVRQGDSALYQGVMVTVVSRGPEPPVAYVIQWNVRLGSGIEVLAAVFADNLTAVRRYDTAPDARWAALRATIKQDRDGYYEQACDHSEMAGHDAQEERAFGRVEECDDLLAAMDRAEKEG